MLMQCYRVHCLCHDDDGVAPYRPGVPEQPKNAALPGCSLVSDHGVENTDRDGCCVIQLRSGLSPLNRYDTASTRMGNVGRPRMRHVCRNDKIRSTQRLPLSLHVPWLRLRHNTPNRWARSATLFVASTPGTSRNTQSDSPSRTQRRANVPALSSRVVC
jgi:hypothetical protein